MKTHNHCLWYKQAAKNWNEALPLGNGRIGAMVYGGAKKEKICLNEDTLWSGYPVTSMRGNMSEIFHNAQNLVLAGKLIEAQKLIEQKFGDFLVQMYLPFGDLDFTMFHSECAENYERRLSLDEAVHTVYYHCDKVLYKRKTVVSPKSQVMAIKVIASERGKVGFVLNLNGKLQTKKKIVDGVIIIDGNCPVCKAPYGESFDNEDKKIYSEIDAEKGVGYRGAVTVETVGGEVSTGENGITVTNADQAVIYFAIRTSFNGYNKHPVLQGKKYKNVCLGDIKKAINRGFQDLMEESIQAHQALYNRMSINLHGADMDLPTDQRICLLNQGVEDNSLYELLFNYGRYLTICSSRAGSQPSNLQGIWNDQTLPPWSSNLTLNINFEMNYWPALQCNLKECINPLIVMIKELCENGKKTSKQYYGISGSVSHNISDLWRVTHPSTNLLSDSCQWGFWNLSSGWLARYLYEYYLFTGDLYFLETEALPVIKEFASFYSGLLIQDNDGSLILCPSTSPENSFVFEGKQTPISKTTTMAMAIIRELFSNYIKACNELGKKDTLYEVISTQLPKLKGYSKTKYGSLSEWYDDYEEADIHHRHLSHLYGLFPGNEISVNKTPELAEACKKTLERRGDYGTGWSLAWKINLWARLNDGNHALSLIKMQLKPIDSGHTEHDSGGGSYINLFCAHPPFQIDGNFGATSGIAQMLLQYDGDWVYLLPALPDSWTNGEVKGMCIPYGATIDFCWENGKITNYKINKAKRQYHLIY